ncbi:hypothetical protein LJC17_03405 [Acholeplasma sp. OttesenSCG-928-E16]|nr:hypothetical protein [Acholeplasma sp. OttesenSCG-928-E16]
MNPVIFFSAIGSAMLINNVIFHWNWGICSFVGVSTKMKPAVGMSLAVIAIMVLATAVTYPIYQLLLVPLQITYIKTIVFILVIAVLVQLTEILLKRFNNGLYKTLGIYLPLITTNCAILGIADIVSMNYLIELDTLTKVLTDSGVGAYFDLIIGNSALFGNGFLKALAVAFGSGLGFALVMVLFTAIRVRLNSANIPKAFKGAPISFVIAGIMAIAFLGFGGIFPEVSELLKNF